MRGNLDPPAAVHARDDIIDAVEVIAELGKLRAVAFVRSWREAVFLDAPHPFDLIVGAPSALRTRNRHRPRFRLLVEEVALVQAHGCMLLQYTPGTIFQ